MAQTVSWFARSQLESQLGLNRQYTAFCWSSFLQQQGHNRRVQQSWHKLSLLVQLGPRVKYTDQYTFASEATYLQQQGHVGEYTKS
jgi:hypothetical protein